MNSDSPCTNKNVLVFNCGSSSLKYRLIELPTQRELAAGEAQRVGPKTAEPARIYHNIDGNQETHHFDMPDHGVAFECVMKLLARDERLTPHLLGHRVVHGGSRFEAPTLVDREVLDALEAIQDMAPLHNPPAIRLVNACSKMYPDLPQVVVFDTAFHSTIPEYARTYALPFNLQHSLGIRKYGFHGISHQYVVNETAEFLKIPLDRFNAVSAHLGSGGASLCAVVGGRSVDNTMGYSPLQGLIMSTRCGDLDPTVALRLLDQSDGDFQTVETILNKRSGVLGMSGVSADIRDILANHSTDDKIRSSVKKAAEVYLWRIRKYLGAYMTAAGNPDAVIFTDTIGETVPEVRWAVCAGMEPFGLRIDAEKNWNLTEYPADVGAPGSRVRAIVIKTNEELAIAKYAFAALFHQN